MAKGERGGKGGTAARRQKVIDKANSDIDQNRAGTSWSKLNESQKSAINRNMKLSDDKTH